MFKYNFVYFVNMKGGVVIGLVLVIVVLSVSLVSASVLGDFFSKITGRAVHERTLTLTASPQSISYGQSTTVSWVSTGFDRCTKSSIPYSSIWNYASEPLSGGVFINDLSSSITFTVTCFSLTDSGSVDTSTYTTKQITVQVSSDIADVTCSDSDGGLDYDNAGYVEMIGDPSFGVDGRESDECADIAGGQYIIEYYCQSNTNPGSTTYRCLNGCDGGACIEEIVCTAEIQLCPDGSFVSPDPNNNCEFDACPSIGTPPIQESGCEVGPGGSKCKLYEGQSVSTTIVSDGRYDYIFSIDSIGLNEVELRVRNDFKGDFPFVDFPLPGLSAEQTFWVDDLPNPYLSDEDVVGVLSSVEFDIVLGDPSIQCTDSDGGLNPNVYGWTDFRADSFELKNEDVCALVSNYDSDGNPQSWMTDDGFDCSGKDCYIQEAFCRTDSDGNLLDSDATKLIECPNGCVDGACVGETPQESVWVGGPLSCRVYIEPGTVLESFALKLITDDLTRTYTTLHIWDDAVGGNVGQEIYSSSDISLIASTNEWGDYGRMSNLYYGYHQVELDDSIEVGGYYWIGVTQSDSGTNALNTGIFNDGNSETYSEDSNGMNRREDWDCYYNLNAFDAAEECIPSYFCETTPAECPSSGVQTKTCEDVTCGTGGDSEVIVCNPGTCSGCGLGDNRCIPYGFRLELNQNNMYCEIDGNLNVQKVKDAGGNWATCQNNYECDSNLCSGGECVEIGDVIREAKGIKVIVSRILCRLADLVGVADYEQCIFDRLGIVE